MKTLSIFFFILASSFLFATALLAQQASTVTHQKHDLSFSMGRDFWLAEMSNGFGDSATGGEYMDLFISSPKKTVANIAYGNFSTSISINIPDSTYLYHLPNSIQMQSSGYAEKKAIHVWSTDAPLDVYNMNHVTYYEDGEYIIPTIGWDTNYVVGAYESLYEGSSFDLPSECAIVTDEDSTGIDITPSVDCRHCPGGNALGDSCSTISAYPAGQTFHVVLNRGESFELMPVKASGPDIFDLTGTIIHSNKPVALLAGSMSPNIPSDFPYDNHVEEMIPSQRTWGVTYYTTMRNLPPGSPNNYTQYLFIASKAAQTIYRSACIGGEGVECQLDKYGIFWAELEGDQKFWSDAPFLLVAYSNSSTYPGGQNGSGDPSECIINPRENFTDTVTFETPQNSGTPYTTSANVTVNIADANSTFYDGQHITGRSSECLDDTFEMFTVPEVGTRAHIISDTAKPSHGGIGVYMYGYGYNESYSWSSPEFEGTFGSKDTTAPIVELSGSCANRRVTFLDTGKNATAVAAIWLDTLSNASFTLDTAYKEGVPVDSEYFDFSVINPSEPAMLRAIAYDFAGNSTTVTLSYAPLPITSSASSLNFGTIISNNQSIILYDTIQNKLLTQSMSKAYIYCMAGVASVSIAQEWEHFFQTPSE